MNASGIAAAPIPRKYAIPLFLALIAAGLAGNYFKYPIFLNIDFLFGSIVALLALQFLGLGWGIGAAALIASATYFIWHHPYAIVIMTAEVAVVGLLVRRYRVGLVLADALYWLCIGIALVYLFYHGVMGVPVGNTTIVMTKQAVNGIANALLARLIFTGIAFKTRQSLIPLRDLTYNLLVLFALGPALILLAAGSRGDFEKTDLDLRAKLQQSIQNLARDINSWVQDREAAVVFLATLAATQPPQNMQQHLEQARATDRNFLRLGLLDKAANTTAFAPQIDEQGQPTIGKNFADRPYIPKLRETLKPMLSEVVMGRIGLPQPIVNMLAPVVIQGEYAGYVSGILSLDRIFQSLKSDAEDEGLNYTLVDKNGNLILTNRPGQRMMAPLARGEGTLTPIGDNLAQWVPSLPANTPISERWKSSFYVTEAMVGDAAEWRLILEQPMAPFQTMLYARYTNALTILFLILLGALALGEFLSRRVVGATERLSVITQDLPEALAAGTPIVWPETIVLELSRLIANFKATATSLATQFSASRQWSQALEQQVAARTHELEESELRWKFAIEGSGDALWDWNLKDNTLFLTERWRELVGGTDSEPAIDISEWEGRIHPEDKAEVLAKLQSYLEQESPNYVCEHRVRCADGSYKWILDRGMVIARNADGKPLRMIGTCSDISARRSADLARQEALSLLEKIASRVPGMVYQFRMRADGSTCIPFASEAIRTLYRVGPEEVRDDATRIFGQTHPDDYEELVKSVLNSARDLSPWRHEFRVRFADGVVRWLLGNALPEREEDGSTLWHGFVTDITERREAEEQLRKLSLAVEQSPEAIVITDVDAQIEYVNESFIHATGFSRAEVIGKSPRILQSGATPSETYAAMWGALTQGQAWAGEFHNKRKDGSVFIEHAIVTPLRAAGGRITHYVAVKEDITEKVRLGVELERHRHHLEQLVEQRTEDVRHANRQLADTQFAMDRAGIGIQWADVDTGRFVYANKFAAELLGYTVDEMLELSVSDIDPSFQTVPFVQATESFRTQRPIRFESTTKTKSGCVIPVEVSIYYLPAAAGGSGRFISFLTDITARKEVEVMLRHAKEGAEAADRAKSTFLANMSHEIRTPLNGILGMAYLVRRSGVTPKQADQLDKIAGSGAHLLSLINDVLDLAKIEAGKVVLAEKEFTLVELLDGVAAVVGESARSKGLSLNFDMVGMPETLHGDATRLTQALVNYVGNAIKFTNHGGVTVKGRLSEESDVSYCLRFEVVDTGIGIPVETQARLFAPFQQADDSATRAYGGTGLGLAITRRIAQLMGGETGVESTYGQGSTFWLTARLGKARAAPAGVEAPSQGSAAAGAEARVRREHRGARILLAEDDPINQEVTLELLRSVGLTPDLAVDGRDAVTMAGRNDYALILMDMQMPEMDGLAATRAIRALPDRGGTPILALTANAFSENEDDCRKAGMNGFIAKPIQPETLFATIAEWLDRH